MKAGKNILSPKDGQDFSRGAFPAMMRRIFTSIDSRRTRIVWKTSAGADGHDTTTGQAVFLGRRCITVAEYRLSEPLLNKSVSGSAANVWMCRRCRYLGTGRSCSARPPPLHTS